MFESANPGPRTICHLTSLKKVMSLHGPTSVCPTTGP